MKGTFIFFPSTMLLGLLVFVVVLGGASAVFKARLHPDMPVGHFEKVEGLMDVPIVEEVSLAFPHWAALYMGSTASRQHQQAGSGLTRGAMADGDCAAVQVWPGGGAPGTAPCVEDVHVREPSCPNGQMLTGYSAAGVVQCQEDPEIRVPGKCVGDGLDITLLADGTVLCTTGSPSKDTF